MTIESLVAAIRDRDPRALPRAITIVESDRAARDELVDHLAPLVKGTARIGITGPPGVGKSSLAARLVASCRARGLAVAMLAVDPTSPLSGGALLGDRVRMEDLLDDRGIYFRSMAARGHGGGLSAATADAADVLDAFGFDRIVIETVGIGQAETEVMNVVDLVLLVLAPGMGDEVQALKAGVLEIADLIIVNKADLAGAEALAADLEEAQGLRMEAALRAPVCKVSVKTGAGLPALFELVERLLQERSQASNRRELLASRGAARVLRIVEQRLLQRWLAEPKLIEEVKAQLRGHAGAPPYATAREVFTRLVREGNGKSW